MPSRKRVRRLGDIAVVHVADLVGRHIAELVRQCDPGELYRNVALVKSNICICVPPAVYDDFAANVLATMSRVLHYYELVNAVNESNVESSVTTILDRLSIVKQYPGVSGHLTALLYRNLHELKKVRVLEIDSDDIFQRQIVRRSFTSMSGDIGEQLNWQKKYDLRFIEKLSCPGWFFHEKTISVLEIYSRLKILIIHASSRSQRTAITIFNALRPFSALREVDLHGFADEFDGVVEDLLSRNPNLIKLAVTCNPEVFLKSTTIYPALRHLQVRHEAMYTPVLRTVATRFPNLTSLDLYLAQGFDPSAFTAFPHLSSLSISVRNSLWADLWVLLREIGEKIVSLVFLLEPITRSDLFSIYQHCRNCEFLVVSFAPFDDVHPLIVPSFPRIKHFEIEIKDRSAMHYRDLKYPLDFTEMLSLEYLKYSNFEIDQTRLESILLDSKNFPRLTKIVPRFDAPEEMRSIPRFIKEHNLDVTFVPIINRPISAFL